MKDALDYLYSWEKFREYCEKRAKDRCVINSSGWSKLREFHLESYLSKQENPFMFLLTVKWKDRRLFDSHRMAKYYYKYLRQKAQSIEVTLPDSVISFPSWRK